MPTPRSASGPAAPRARVRTCSAVVVLLLLAGGGLDARDVGGDETVAGWWTAHLQCPGGNIEFGLLLKSTDTRGWTAFLVNGQERTEVPRVSVEPTSVTLGIDHFDSEIRWQIRRDETGRPVELVGRWRKRRGPDTWVELPSTAHPTALAKTPDDPDLAQRFAGRWAVDFQHSEDPAVGIFSTTEGTLAGTFLTTTGDYRFLAGRANLNDQQSPEMELSCFDGAHAFLFRATITDQDQLNGEFWSSDTWHETWTARRDPGAKLPDAFEQTVLNRDARLAQFAFPDLRGEMTNLDDPRFRGRARLLYVFGSWCPNCHDAAAYFSELAERYDDRGLSILGLAFELTGDFERDAAQVKKYLDRHECRYPVLLAGTSDKAKASRTFPLVDRVRSYPTTIFIDRHGKVVAIHTGFSGPATGAAYEELKREFESRIESMLAD